jgi:two-component system, response regulator, stage 0 sporulation protein F
MKPKINLLVVDDEPDAAPLFRQRFRKELEKGWVRLETAENGAEALQLLEHYHREIPLIILSDINMPGMDGIELLQRIRNAYPDLQVWMVSAYTQTRGYEAQAAHHGAKGFIPKPIDFTQLKEQIFAGI